MDLNDEVREHNRSRERIAELHERVTTLKADLADLQRASGDRQVGLEREHTKMG